MSAASPSPPPPLTPGLTRYSPPTLSQGQKPQRPQHALAYCLNGNPVMKNFESFEALSNELNALASSRDDGALVDQVEIKFEYERLRELQCEQLASRIGFGIPLKKVFDFVLILLLCRTEEQTLTCSRSCHSIVSIILTSIHAFGSPKCRKRVLAILD